MTDMEEKDDTVSMNVTIADRVYPLRVMAGDEEKVRQAVKLVNEKVKEYQRLFEGKDKQDYMAMCLLNFATDKINLQSGIQDNHRLLEQKMTELEATLASA